MPSYEYKVIPAPQKGLKGKGVRGAEARFSNALESVMNDLGAQGWEYCRAETLPSLERSGLASTTTEWRNVLVFRRPRETAAANFAPELLPPPEIPPETIPDKTPGPEAQTPGASPLTPVEQASQMALKNPETVFDNGVEDADNVADIGASLEKLAAARKSLKTEG